MWIPPARIGAAMCGFALTGLAFAAPVPESGVAMEPAAQAEKPANGPAPKITFDATEVNLGDVVRGKEAVATFTYHNTGTAPLHILSAKPG